MAVIFGYPSALTMATSRFIEMRRVAAAFTACVCVFDLLDCTVQRATTRYAPMNPILAAP